MMTDVAVVSPATESRTLPIIGWASCLLGVAPVGLLIALIDKKNAPDWVRTHYSYLVRTILLGLLYGFVVFAFTMATTFLILLPVGMLFFPLVAIWFLVRCVIGLVAAIRCEPIKRPRTWLV